MQIPTLTGGEWGVGNVERNEWCRGTCTSSPLRLVTSGKRRICTLSLASPYRFQTSTREDSEIPHDAKTSLDAVVCTGIMESLRRSPTDAEGCVGMHTLSEGSYFLTHKSLGPRQKNRSSGAHVGRRFLFPPPATVVNTLLCPHCGFARGLAAPAHKYIDAPAKNQLL